MANLAASAVTVVSSWTEGGTNSKRHIAKIVRLVLTGQGGTTNKIIASALGFTKVEQCSNAVVSDNSAVIPAVPAYGGTAVLLLDATQAADANRALPADFTSVTVELTVKGY